MPTYDFIYDLLEKLESQGFEYVLTYNLTNDDNEKIECTMQSNMESENILKILEGIKARIEEQSKPKKKKKNGRRKSPRKEEDSR